MGNWAIGDDITLTVRAVIGQQWSMQAGKKCRFGFDGGVYYLLNKWLNFVIT